MAEDRWEVELHEGSFGAVPLHFLSVEDDLGYDLAVHEYPHVDGANKVPMGRRGRVTRASLIFFASGPEDDYFSRFQAFDLLAGDQEPQTLTHPLTGSYSALVGDLVARASAEQRDTILVDCTFEESSTSIAVLEAGGGSPRASGLPSVEVEAAAVDAAVAGAGGSTTVGADAVAVVTAWQAAPSATRAIRLELADLSSRIESEAERLQAATDIKRHGLYRALIRLRYSLRKAALLVMQDAPRLVEITVRAPVPLVILAAEIYGASEAHDRTAQLRRLNNVPNPARLEAGQVLRVQAAPAPARRRRSR